MACHNDFVPPLPPAPGHHVKNRDDPFGAGDCTQCHGADINGDLGPSCFTCHDQIWPDPDFGPLADANGPYAAEAGTPIRFDGSGSVDADGTIVAYDWDFGDGNSGTGASLFFHLVLARSMVESGWWINPTGATAKGELKNE